jgi:uncharacterized membrane protein YgaE (UPF0421/DUF939 family)
MIGGFAASPFVVTGIAVVTVMSAPGVPAPTGVLFGIALVAVGLSVGFLAGRHVFRRDRRIEEEHKKRNRATQSDILLLEKISRDRGRGNN